MPLSVHGVNWLWGNSELWRRFELTASDTWLAMLQHAQQAGIIPFAIGNHEEDVAMLFNVVAVGSMGEEHFRRIMVQQGLQDTDEQAIEQVFSRLSSLYPLMPDNYRDLSFRQALTLMTEGKVLMTLQGTWSNAMLSEQGLKPQVDYECVRFPDTQSMPVFVSDIIVAYGNGPASSATRRQLAELLIDKEFQQAWSLKSGGLPARVDVNLALYNECAQQVMKDMRSPHMRETTLFLQEEFRLSAFKVLNAHFAGQLTDQQATLAMLQVLTGEP